MKIILADEEINLKLTMERIDKIEGLSGHSIFSFPDRCADKSLKTKDIVVLYWQAQQGTSYSKEQIFQKVMSDGLASHYSQICTVLMAQVYGEKVMKQLEKDFENGSGEDAKKKS